MDRTVVITGASSGVGLAAAEQLAAKGDEVVVVGRNPERLAAAMQKVEKAAKVHKPGQFRADFESFDDVRRLADHLLTTYPKIDVLANNAGGVVAGQSRTADGFEPTVQANHLAGFLLSNLLREQLRNGRIINTASAAHAMGTIDPSDLRGEHKAGMWKRYGAAKQANILFAAEAARRWPDIMSAAYHPGFVRSRFGAGIGVNLMTKVTPFAKTPEQGADTLVWLVATPRPQLVSGGYYEKRKLIRPNAATEDPGLAARLWDASMAAVGF